MIIELYFIQYMSFNIIIDNAASCACAKGWGMQVKVDLWPRNTVTKHNAGTCEEVVAHGFKYFSPDS